MAEWGNTMSRSAGSGDPAAHAREIAAAPERSTVRAVAARHGADDRADDAPGTSDEQLLRAAARGDHDAFTQLYRRHWRQLQATALRTIRDQCDAEDCLQEAMLRAYQLSPKFRGDCKVASWLHRIVINACLDRARRNQIRVTLPMPDDLSGLGSDEGRTVEEFERRFTVDEALRMLPEDQRAAVIAVDMHGLSVATAADVLGVAVGTVKSRRARARARLERLLG